MKGGKKAASKGEQAPQIKSNANGMITASNEVSNITEYLSMHAKTDPTKKAYICYKKRGGWASMTYAELDKEVDRIAGGLKSLGIMKGMKTIFMVRPSPEFFSMAFALLRLGAVPVMIDPGMGIKRMVKSLSEIDAEAFVGIPLAHMMRVMYPRSFKGVKIKVVVGSRLLWGAKTVSDLKKAGSKAFKPAVTKPGDMAAIFFTTGSTGPPKGVVYENGMFYAQIGYLNKKFGYSTQSVELATFPLFSLFDVILGMTSVVPDMDPTKPAQADPKKLISAIQANKCTNMYGSPALLENLARYAIDNGIKLKTLNVIITAGAPIRPSLLESLHKILPPDALVHTPYGATEVLPVSDIDSRQILDETRAITESGGGMCVGWPMDGITVRMIALTDDPLESIGDAKVLPVGKIGEIAVKGPNVTKTYYRKPEHTARAKMKDPDGSVWHRMGDAGYLDDKGRLWFCGRKAHRVRTKKGDLFTIPCEALFNNHPHVRRSALVGVGNPGSQTPVIIIELKDPKADKQALTRELLRLAKRSPITKDIKTVLYHPKFPVDIRHNAKIFREKLAAWAQGVG